MARASAGGQRASPQRSLPRARRPAILNSTPPGRQLRRQSTRAPFLPPNAAGDSAPSSPVSLQGVGACARCKRHRQADLRLEKLLTGSNVCAKDLSCSPVLARYCQTVHALPVPTTVPALCTPLSTTRFYARGICFSFASSTCHSSPAVAFAASTSLLRPAFVANLATVFVDADNCSVEMIVRCVEVLHCGSPSRGNSSARHSTVRLFL